LTLNLELGTLNSLTPAVARRAALSQNQPMRHTNNDAAPRRFRVAATVIILIFLVAILAACAGRRSEERRYELKGKVVAVDRAKGEVTVDHDEIVGYMPAMTMPYTLRDADALKV